jgi:hypothetical protein
MNTQKKNGWCNYKMMETLEPNKNNQFRGEELQNNIVRHSNTEYQKVRQYDLSIMLVRHMKTAKRQK